VTRVLSYQAANAVAEGKLKIVLADYEPEPLPVNPGLSRAKPVAAKTRAFLDFVAPRIRDSVAKATVSQRLMCPHGRHGRTARAGCG